MEDQGPWRLVLVVIWWQERQRVWKHGDVLARRRWFLFRKRSMTFLTADAVIGSQAFHNGRCYICFSLGLDKVETGYNLLMEQNALSKWLIDHIRTGLLPVSDTI